jgi:hypothetical protein
MNPIRSTELSLRFAGTWSPAWLIVILPVVLVLGVILLRGQFPDVRRPRAIGLALLRLLLLAVVAVLAFRPDIVLTETLTWLGRVIVLVDNSASMGVVDPALPAGDALRLARVLDAKLEPREAHDRAESLLATADVLARFEPVSRDGDREDEAFWAKAEAAEQQVGQLLATAAAADLLPQIGPLFGGPAHAGRRAFAAAREALTSRAAEIRKQGDDRDAATLADGGPAAAALGAAVESVREENRIDLVKAVLAQLPGSLPDQRLDVIPLVESATTERFALAPGGTDLGGRLGGLVADPESDAAGAADRSPINAILLVSDGRDTTTAEAPSAAILTRLTERTAPVIACGVGGVAEPFDLAVLGVTAPPIAVAGTPLAVTVRLKTAVSPQAGDAGRATLTLDSVAATAPLASADLNAGSAALQTVVLSFTPAATESDQPPQRLAIDIKPVPGEVVPADNNRQEFTVAVRREPVRVLLLDAVPRWETRFAINTLKRLPFVELNSIVASTRPQGQVARGVQRGTWPADEPTLGLYTVVVLGRLPDDMLTAAERESLSRWVREGGGTIVELAPEGAGSVAVADWQLRLTTVGAAHPLTRRLPVPGLPEAAQPDAAAGETPLLVTLDPAGGPPVPLIAVARAGAGRRVTIASDALWRALNPRSLDAHTSLYAELISWAALTGPTRASAASASLPAAAAEATIEPDMLTTTDSESITATLPESAAEAADVDVIRAGEPVARVSSRRGTVVVPAQRPGTVQLRLAGTSILSRPIEVVADDPELRLLGRNEEWLATLASRSGGSVASLADLPRLARSIPPKSHVERQERVWRPWNSGWTVALLAGLLILEWVWRKWEGLV